MRTLTLLALLSCLPFFAFAQFGDIKANDDSLCIRLGENFMLNVTDNDDRPADYAVFLTDQSNCFFLESNGQLFFTGEGEECCGQRRLRYAYNNCEGDNCFAFIDITVKCEKPECFIVDLSDFVGATTPGGEPGSCIAACEFSEATYFINYNPTFTYSWTVTGGTFITGNNPAEIIVSWGAGSTGSIALTVVTANNEVRQLEFCVDLLESPVAAFAPLSADVCKNSPVSFTNNSTGASDYFWDFGDGQNSTQFEPTHQYTNPGTYTVTLYATRNNYDPQGNPLCCCTDSTSVEITVDPLEGPDIYWISTLCANDDSKYWTDAPNCGTYDWAVFDADGVALTFDGQGNDTICVQWGDGPFGTIELLVDNCDSAYCDKPTTVVVPIISSTVLIDGLTEVCAGSIANYTVPKWISVIYDWQVTGGTILAGAGTNSITVQWGFSTPGTIHLDYYSDFLGGLPGQDPLDCGGMADLSVDIKPEFNLFGPSPNVVCVGTNSFIFATAFPSNTYTWSIDPPVTFSGQGTSSINATWDNGPGTFTITAVPTDTSVYCNDTVRTIVQVSELAPPDAIDGPTEICPGESATYFVQTSASGVSFNWTVVGGSLSSPTGNPVVVTWNNSGSYSLAVSQTQLAPPNCTSDTIQLVVEPIALLSPLVITGPDACTNTIQSYNLSPPQHPDATYNWFITPATAGSVTSGQSSLNVDVQWNNDPGNVAVNVTVELCGNTLTDSLSLVLDAAPAPTITQTGILCPGQTATLDAGPGYATYLWSTGSTTQTTSINSAGTYTVMVTDSDGCNAVGLYTASSVGGPVAKISTPGPTTFCTQAPNDGSVTLTAQTGAGYSFQWYCGTSPQAPQVPPSSFTHDETGIAGSYAYWVAVSTADGCVDSSNVITIVEESCTPTGPVCLPRNHTLDITASNPSPDCATANFTVTETGPVVVHSYDFGDGSILNTNALTASHTYTEAGYYLTTVHARVWARPQSVADSCDIRDTVSVCIPLAADFSAQEICDTVHFTDQSTFLPGNDITSWSWSFGDSNTSTVANPVHGYLAPGTYSVTLTVSNAANCTATSVQNVTVAGPPTPTISPSAATVCVGETVNFVGGGTNILSWLWDFGDGASFGEQNPSHVYNSPGTYTVSLTVTDNRGCEGSTSTSITVVPGPPADTIAYSPGLTICEGDVVTLTAPSGFGYTYMWSTSATTASITVGTAGTYGVLIKDANDCEYAPDSVEVIVIPAPPAEISGPAFICDGGCITLRAPQGYNYQWLDGSNSPIPGAVNANLTVCANSLASPYSVIVTDDNGCSAQSAPFSVGVATPPSFSIAITPDPCAESPSVLTITPVQSGVDYVWNTGATGTSITVTQAGTYTAVGTDTATGCTASASATIHPLPDLCLVPVGCYETCNPDTICGPSGLTAYQWYQNGLPITGANQECLIVTESGSYSLLGTNEFGCEETSDSLYLEVIDCDCEALEASITPLEADSCCYSLSYTHAYDDLYGIMIHSGDTDFDFDLASLDSDFSVFTIGANYLGLVNSTAGDPIPDGNVDDFIEFCLTNVKNRPQQIVIDWYDFDLEVVCSDTLRVDCPVEPECLYVASDSIFCEGSTVVYEMTVCNPIDAAFPISYIQILADMPVGVVVTPPFIDETSNPIQNGECRTYTLNLSGPNLGGQDFCYQLVAHNADPAVVDTALCCSENFFYCIPIPDCDPCDDIGVEKVEPFSAADTEECCYRVSLFNNYEPDYFDGIDLCVLSPNTSLSIQNTFGSGWVSSINNSQTMASLTVAPSTGTHLPLGPIQLPTICIDTDEPPLQQIEIKWMKDGEIVCRDTIELGCEPPCGYMLEEKIECNNDGTWTYSGLLKNTSPYTMSEAHFVFTSPAGMAGYNQTVPLGGLSPNMSTFFSLLPIGSPAMPGDTVCFTVALHEINHNDAHTNCCNFTHCIVLPPCEPACICDKMFFDDIKQGMQCVFENVDDLTGTFSPNANFTDCDLISWSWGDGSPVDETTGSASIEHTFPQPGAYEVCMKVVRTDENGEECSEEFCKTIQIGMITNIAPTAYPNPVAEELHIDLGAWQAGDVQIRLYDINGIDKALLRPFTNEKAARLLRMSVGHLPSGLYLLEVRNGEERWVQKVVVRGE